MKSKVVRFYLCFGMQHKIYLLLGGNEGDRKQNLERGRQLLADKCGTITTASRLYETAAWGLEDQPAFLNQAVEMTTSLSPETLLYAIHEIEAVLGRQRTIRWGSRTLDIDILFYDKASVDLPHLQIPHPALPQRRFALAPLQEIAPDFIHPQLGKTITELLDVCEDLLPVVPILA